MTDTLLRPHDLVFRTTNTVPGSLNRKVWIRVTHTPTGLYAEAEGIGYLTVREEALTKLTELVART